MPSYADIAARVAGIVVSPSAYVQDAIPRLVFEAQREAERRYAFSAMRGVLRLQTIPGTNESGIVATPLVDTFFDRGATASHRYLRPLRENPYWAELPTTLAALAFNSASTELVTLVKGEEDGKASINISNVIAGSATDLKLQQIHAGMTMRMGNFPQVGDSLLIQGTPYPIRSVIGKTNTSPRTFFIQITIPDAALATGPLVYNIVNFQFEWDTPTAVHPMAWITESDVLSLYGSQTVDGEPKHVCEAASTDIGEPHFLVYPKHSTTAYTVMVPAVFHLGSSLLDVPTQSSSCWFTNFGDVYLERRAAAEALLLEEDLEKAALWSARADQELQRLIRQDKNESVKSGTLRLSQSVRGPMAQRSPRF